MWHLKHAASLIGTTKRLKIFVISALDIVFHKPLEAKGKLSATTITLERSVYNVLLWLKATENLTRIIFRHRPTVPFEVRCLRQVCGTDGVYGFPETSVKRPSVCHGIRIYTASCHYHLMINQYWINK